MIRHEGVNNEIISMTRFGTKIEKWDRDCSVRRSNSMAHSFSLRSVQRNEIMAMYVWQSIKISLQNQAFPCRFVVRHFFPLFFFTFKYNRLDWIKYFACEETLKKKKSSRNVQRNCLPIRNICPQFLFLVQRPVLLFECFTNAMKKTPTLCRLAMLNITFSHAITQLYSVRINYSVVNFNFVAVKG